LLLAVGQVLSVLPEREPGAFEILGELLVTGAAGFVPDLAADLIQCVYARTSHFLCKRCG